MVDGIYLYMHMHGYTSSEVYLKCCITSATAAKYYKELTGLSGTV